MPENQDSIRRILDELVDGGELSQRALAARLGIALGRVNQLLRILIDRQWVRGGRGPGQRIRYLVTPDGEHARARISREELGRALLSYATVRDRVRDRLEACGADEASAAASLPPAVALYGTGEVAQIVFACAAELGVPLVGFIDDHPRESYLGLPVLAPSTLTSMSVNGRTFEWLLVATLTDQDSVRARLVDLGFPLERVRWL
jgi:DNA-binding MarR family transcriptional regulator